MRVFVLLTVFLGAGPLQASDELVQAVSDAIRVRLEEAGTPPRLVIDGEVVYSSASLLKLYDQRAFQPAWIGAGGVIPLAGELREAILSAERHGLRPEDYHLGLIEQAAATAKTRPLHPGRLADLDLVLSDAFLVYASSLLHGHVDPETIDVQWFAERPEGDLVALFEEAIDERNVGQVLERVTPSHPAYRRLVEVLENFRRKEMEGGFPRVQEGTTLREGDRGPAVALVRDRLAISDAAGLEAQEEELFDGPLRKSVESFQRRHGLEPDGVVGPATIAAMNVGVGDRIEQIKVNLERWRWLPVDLGQRYIVVNIAGFKVDVVDQGKRVLSMRAVVGRPYRSTPVMSHTMTYLVFSPFWNVPQSIATRDILPRVQRDPRHLEREKIRVLRGWSAGAQPIAPSTINWRSLSTRNFPYRLRQDPGPRNALGRVKFMFPNRFSVYLHDTPATELFERAARDFSSGCIRVEKPVELSQYLLADDPSWTRETILAAMNQSSERNVRLRRPIPVHLLYWTVWAEEDGTVQFREDIYARDARLRAALLVRPERE